MHARQKNENPCVTIVQNYKMLLRPVSKSAIPSVLLVDFFPSALRTYS